MKLSDNKAVNVKCEKAITGECNFQGCKHMEEHEPQICFDPDLLCTESNECCLGYLWGCERLKCVETSTNTQRTKNG